MVAPDDVVGVTADGREVDDADVRELFGLEVEALRRVMALALSAGTEAAQPVKPVPAPVAIVPGDLEDRIVVGQFNRFRKSFGGAVLLAHRVDSSFAQ